MPRPSRTDGLPDSVRRVLIAELNKTQHDQIQLLKSIDSKLTVLISKIHNLGVDVTSREVQSSRLVAILSELLETPAQTQGEALAVVKDFLFNVTKTKK